MIQTFVHKGLRDFFLNGTKSGIQPQHAERLRLILIRLHVAREPSDMALPGLRFHRLKGQMEGLYSVWVNGNWRVVFRFKGFHAYDVDYVDYH